MLFAVFDTETTGLGVKDEVCEVGIILIDSTKPQAKNWKLWSSLVRPTVPVTIGARVSHHITDAELSAAPPMSEVKKHPFMKKLCDPKTIPVAHNLKFDLRLLAQSGVQVLQPAICTLQCARHIVSGVEHYSNQWLRYALDLAVPSALVAGVIPHRALPDCVVTAPLFLHLQDRASAVELLELTNKRVLMKTCNIRKYKGKPWSEIKDTGWLEWITKSDFDDDTKHTAAFWLKCHSKKVYSKGE